MKKVIIFLIIICIVVFLFGLITIIQFKEKKDNFQKTEDLGIEEFFETNDKQNEDSNSKTKTVNSVNYIAIIEIKKISLKTGMVDIKNKNNTVEHHVTILNGSSMPDVEGGNFILASHSGNSLISYFKNLHKLEKGDTVSIYYKNYKYNYKIYEINKQNKNGNIEINRDYGKTTLTLTTCDVKDKTKQLVVLAEFINKEKIKEEER